MSCAVLYIAGTTIGFGGAGRDLLSIVTHLDHKRFQPVVTFAEEGSIYRRLCKARVETVKLILPPWRKVCSGWRIPGSVYGLVRVIQRYEISLIHANDFWYAPFAYLAARVARIPCVAHVRSEISIKKMRQYCLPRMDWVCPVSDSLAGRAL